MAGKAVCTFASLRENASKRSILFLSETRLYAYKYLHVTKQNLVRRLLSFSLRWNWPCVNTPKGTIWFTDSTISYLRGYLHFSDPTQLRARAPRPRVTQSWIIRAFSLNKRHRHTTGWSLMVCAAKACDTGLVTKDSHPLPSAWMNLHLPGDLETPFPNTALSLQWHQCRSYAF